MGGARTALFNYLFARHHEGTFVLRVEDTDLKRSKAEYTEAILEAMDWLGMPADEGPYFQTKRSAIYREKVDELLESGAAYKCFATEEELAEERKKAEEAGRVWQYARTWRDRDDHPEGQPYTVRIKAPLEGAFTIKDGVQGEVTVEAEELDDFIIMRSDGTPTYNFVVVVDDVLMEISHVIRGKDHLNNTFRQLVVYDALDAEPPEFAHLPLIAGLSKRKGSLSVQAYRQRGYLREGIINYICRLGWAHGDQEIFSMDELVELFTLDGVGRSSGQFDDDKFAWVNGQWMQKLGDRDLAKRWQPFLEEKGYNAASYADLYRLASIVAEMKKRAQTLVEMAEISHYFFSGEFSYDEEAAEKWLVPSRLDLFGDLRDELASLDEWDGDGIESVFRGLCDTHDLGLGKVAQPTRVALTGSTASPGLFVTTKLVGRDETLERLDRAISYIEERSDDAS
jgi:glutamyl-tRNA synthetase